MDHSFVHSFIQSRPPVNTFKGIHERSIICMEYTYVRSYSIQHCTLGTTKVSTLDLKLINASINPFTLFKSCFLLASQLRSFTFPLFVVTTEGEMPASSTITAENTSSTPLGGFVIVLHSPKSLLFRVSRAAFPCLISFSCSCVFFCNVLFCYVSCFKCGYVSMYVCMYV